MLSRNEILIALGLVATIGVWAYLIERGAPAEAPRNEASAQSEASPERFAPDTAMRAIFGVYNAEQQGVLLPLPLTRSWAVADAAELAAPLLVATYREGGTEKGVLAVERRRLSDGRPEDSHGTPAVISVYVFRHEGSRWVFEKGRKEAAEAGAYGQAPDVSLVRLGDARYGLMFRGGFTNQGTTESYAFILGLSEARIEELASFDMGSDNGGNCADGDESLPPCWSTAATLSFLREPDQDYYLVRRAETRTGAAANDADAAPVAYYRLRAGRYAKVPRPDLKGVQAVPEAQVYSAGQRLDMPPRR